MKATGIVRRIDELGRVVIPKEIRRTQRIRQGDTLEIFTAADGEVVFKKYSPLVELGHISEIYTDVLSKSLGRTVLVCDRARIVAAAGTGKSDMMERDISTEAEHLLSGRATYTAPENPARRLHLFERGERLILCAAPIIAHGDIEGGVLLPGTARDPSPRPETVQAITTAAHFLARWMEE